MRLPSTPVLLWGLEGRQKSVACLTLRPPGEGRMTALALWERFPRAVLGYLSGEMLNISQGFLFVCFYLWNRWTYLRLGSGCFISGWSSVNLRSDSRLWLSLVNYKTSHLGLGFGAACLKGWSLALVSEEHIKTSPRNAMVIMDLPEDDIRYWQWALTPAGSIFWAEYQ